MSFGVASGLCLSGRQIVAGRHVCISHVLCGVQPCGAEANASQIQTDSRHEQALGGFDSVVCRCVSAVFPLHNRAAFYTNRVYRLLPSRMAEVRCGQIVFAFDSELLSVLRCLDGLETVCSAVGPVVELSIAGRRV